MHHYCDSYTSVCLKRKKNCIICKPGLCPDRSFCCVRSLWPEEFPICVMNYTGELSPHSVVFLHLLIYSFFSVLWAVIVYQELCRYLGHDSRWLCWENTHTEILSKLGRSKIFSQEGPTQTVLKMCKNYPGNGVKCANVRWKYARVPCSE